MLVLLGPRLCLSPFPRREGRPGLFRFLRLGGLPGLRSSRFRLPLVLLPLGRRLSRSRRLVRVFRVCLGVVVPVCMGTGGEGVG